MRLPNAAEGNSIYLSTSKGMCRECGKLVQVRYISLKNRVYLERYCNEHGTSRALVAEDLGWYLHSLKTVTSSHPPLQTVAKRADCPNSCGPCSFHAQRCNLPVFSITNCCDLSCPICFTYNRNDKKYFLSPKDFDKQIDFIIESTTGVDLINITGGEPTLHPQLFDLLQRAKRPEIGRITVNTNGLQIARHPDIAKQFSDLGAYVILSLDTLDSQKSIAVHGKDIVKQKLKALKHLEKYNVQTTLLMVLIGGVNEDELESIVNVSLQKDFIRSLTIQTMTYTGEGGSLFQPRKHIPVDGVENMIEQATRGRISRDNFIPLPTAHPLCYGVCYLLTGPSGEILPLTEVFGQPTLSSHLSDGYLLKPSQKLQTDLKQAINRLWSEGGNESKLKLLKDLLKKTYPPNKKYSVSERQRIGETMIKTIYIHAHMDEDTYEIGRAIRCPDQVPVDNKKMIGACNYNLFYRMNDERFWKKNG